MFSAKQVTGASFSLFTSEKGYVASSSAGESVKIKQPLCAEALGVVGYMVANSAY